MSLKPYTTKEGSKKEQVAQMFNKIAPKYDALNSWLSFRVDKIWRRNVVKNINGAKYPDILDVATGTGDLAITIAKKVKVNVVYGVDISVEMLKLAQQKVEKNQLHQKIFLKEGDSENLQFDDNEFDFITVAFGVRNFENRQKGLKEMCRVLKPNGRLIVLELTNPTKFPMKHLYKIYFFKFLPWMGGLFTKDKEAYTYLPNSVSIFPEGKEFEKELIKAGLNPVKMLKQTFGIATIYVAEKKM